MNYYLAVHICECRTKLVLVHAADGKLISEEISSFKTGDAESIVNGVVLGLKKCAESGKAPVSVGVDTVKSGFVGLDKSGELISDCEVNAAEIPAGTEKLLSFADYVNYRLTGKITSEYTFAAASKIIGTVPENLFGETVKPGTVIGGFTDNAKEFVGFDAQVTAVCSAAAISAAVILPLDEKSAFIFSGKRSVAGRITEEADTSEKARNRSLINVASVSGNVLCKDTEGLKILKAFKKESGKSFEELGKLAAEAHTSSRIMCQDPAFDAPESMTEAIKDSCQSFCFKVPQNDGEIAKIIYNSIRDSYCAAAAQLEAMSETKIETVYLVGKNCFDTYFADIFLKKLNKYEHYAYGGFKNLVVGPENAPALGNAAVQMLGKEFANLSEIQKAVALSFETKEYMYKPGM